MNGEALRIQEWVVIGMFSTWAALAMISTVLLAFFEPTHSLETILSVIFAALGTGPVFGRVWPHIDMGWANWYHCCILPYSVGRSIGVANRTRPIPSTPRTENPKRTKRNQATSVQNFAQIPLFHLIRNFTKTFL